MPAYFVCWALLKHGLAWTEVQLGMAGPRWCLSPGWSYYQQQNASQGGDLAAAVWYETMLRGMSWIKKLA